ncbi:MAG: TonB-dependent receptor [Gemmatimonadales bacterium]|nr:MAG: TonB-dependent receptor [Gemmatimonadales bacterium]
MSVTSAKSAISGWIGLGLTVALLGGLPGEGTASVGPPGDRPAATGGSGADPAGVPNSRPDTLQVVVEGQIRMEAYRGGPALPGAVIELRQGDRLRTAVSDSSGRYRVEGVTGGGTATLQVRHMAAEPHAMQLLLPARGAMSIDVELERRAITLPAIRVFSRGWREVAARPAAPFSTADPRHPRVRLVVMQSTSGLVESGLVGRARADAPGEENRPPEQALFMRGSTVDSRMVLLDGAPVLTPFHLAGLVSSFDSRSLGGADVHLGGAPARFEGGLSYVLDVESRRADPEAPRFEAALDGLAVRGGLNLVRGERAGLAVTARRFHGSQAALTPSSTLPYSFDDLLARGDLSLGRAGELRATLFRNREGVRLDVRAFGDGAGSGSNATGVSGGGSGVDGAGERTEWGNDAASLRWRADWAGTRIELLGATARYRAALPIEWDDLVFARTRTDRHRFELQMERPWAEGLLRWGGSHERQRLRYAMELAAGGLAEGLATARLADGPDELRADRTGLFAEAEMKIGEGARLRTGGRMDHFDRESTVRLSPRASLAVALTDDARLTISGGAFHQYVPEPGLQEDAREEAPSELRWNAQLGVASATHLVIELDQELSPEFSLGVSGFVKRFQEQGARGVGRINASGTDLRVRRQGDRVEGWVGYALSWYWEPGPGAAPQSGRGSGSEFSGRHLLTTGARYDDPSGFQLGLSLEYGAGLPLTEVPLVASPEHAGPVTGVRNLSGAPTIEDYARSSTDNPLDLVLEDDFLRVDFEASWVTRPVVAGRTTELRPYLRVLNALDRRDALFYYFDQWRDAELRPLAERPVVPLMGLEWRF